MATRRKNGADEASATRGFTVVLEEMRGHFKVFGEQLGALGERMTSLEGTVTGLGGKVTSLEGKVTSLEGQVSSLEGQVSSLEGQVAAVDGSVTALDHKVDLGFARVEHRLSLVELAVIEHTRELKRKVDRDEVEGIVERVVARAAPR